MTTITLQQAAAACESRKTSWLKLKSQLADAEQEYREQLIDTENRIPDRLRELRDIIDVKKWEVNQAAGLYIRAHEEVQRISIRTGLDEFMQQNGAALAAILAPEVMHLDGQSGLIKHRALDRAAAYLREALSVWLTAGHEIHYADNHREILTAAGFRPDAASRVDNQEKYTPAQSLIYARKRTELTAQQSA
ncbi:phage polarity suppression protein [Mangrovibacter sp. SLW1]